MAERTAIQWVDSTVNPVMGCAGCELWVPGEGGPCYAGQEHRRKGQVSPGFAPTFDLPTLFRGRTARAARWSDLTGRPRPGKPWLDGSPRLIFVSDMGDALSEGAWVEAGDVETLESAPGRDGRPRPRARAPRAGAVREGGVPFEALREEVVEVARSPAGRRHRWLWLTKRPARLAALSAWLAGAGEAWPANLWVGTSVTGRASVGRARALLQVGDAGTLRFLSVEPLWEPVSLAAHLGPGRIGWVVAGGESRQQGHTARSLPLDWLRSLRDQCRAAGAPFFLKQLGCAPRERGAPWPLALDRSRGGVPDEWPEDLRVREIPRPGAGCGGAGGR